MKNIVRIGGKEFHLPIDISNYWGIRLHHDIYRLCVAVARGMFHDAKSAIDVGSYTGGLICELDWIEKRVASDIQKHLTENWKAAEGVTFVAGDAFQIEFENLFDLVISNQTIEHVENPEKFVRKLLSLGRGLIVSTTYEVPHGMIDGHIQDPIDFEKFQGWFPCELDAWFVCHHPTNRVLKHIIGVVKQSHPNRFAA